MVEAREGVSLNTDAKEMVATIERMYSAFGLDDRVHLDEVLSPDFHAFENGIHMTGRELLDLMSGCFAEGKRFRWSVTSPQVEVQGDLGAVVYLNVGAIVEAPASEPIPLSWLETVLLRRQESGWRVAFIHSTRTKAVPSAA